jgi:hypothetical protein
MVGARENPRDELTRLCRDLGVKRLDSFGSPAGSRAIIRPTLVKDTSLGIVMPQAASSNNSKQPSGGVQPPAHDKRAGSIVRHRPWFVCRVNNAHYGLTARL